jgi:hypothetical protein
MKLKFPNNITEFHAYDGSCYHPDVDGNMETNSTKEFLAAGFTHAEAVEAPDITALTTVDVEGEQKIPKGVKHGIE